MSAARKAKAKPRPAAGRFAQGLAAARAKRDASRDLTREDLGRLLPLAMLDEDLVIALIVSAANIVKVRRQAKPYAAQVDSVIIAAEQLFEEWSLGPGAGAS